MTKVCSKCGEARPDPEGFYGAGRLECKECTLKRRKAYYAANKVAIKARVDVWQAANPSKAKAYKKRWKCKNPERVKEQCWRDKGIVGMTIELYDQMFAAQGGKCAMPGCGREAPESQSLHVDHDHATGQPRALLCAGCNLGLGAFRDRPELLRAGAEYVERHKCR